METAIEKYDLGKFEALTDLLLRNFPDFWTERLAKGRNSFPYDLQLFVLREKESSRPIGTIGVHDYSFVYQDQTILIGGVCDVGVDPDFRQQGLAKKMLSFLMDHVRRHSRYSGMALYTEKPWAYLTSGFTLYEPPVMEEAVPELPQEQWITLSGLPQDDPLRRKVIAVYENASAFPGKCVRSSKTWEEIFEEETHLFNIQESSYFLRKKELLLEAYSPEKSFRCNGNLDGNVLMTLPFYEDTFARLVRERTLFFPAADIF